MAAERETMPHLNAILKINESLVAYFYYFYFKLPFKRQYRIQYALQD